MTDDEEQRLDERLTEIRVRLQQIADAAVRASWVKGSIADDEIWREKATLLQEAEAILNKLEEGSANA